MTKDYSLCNTRLHKNTYDGVQKKLSHLDASTVQPDLQILMDFVMLGASNPGCTL